MSLKDKLLKNSTIKMSATLDNSKLFNDVDVCQTRVPLLNLALSGKFNGGLTSGLTVLAGPSKHFKSNLGLVLVSSYMKKHADAICLFYDSEFGSKDSYFRSQGVDPERVIHNPIKNIEELKFDIVKQLEEIERGEHVIVFIDSIGNTASKKELEDALNEKSVTDMSRAKQIKSLFRMITPYLTLKDLPCVAINHTYETQEMFSKTVMSGGTGIQYSADTVFIIGRQQQKEGTEIVGYNFVLNIEKSRYIKEKSKLPISVTFEGGINTFSGLLDLAQEVGFVVKPKNGWYARAYLDEETGEIVPEDKNWRAKDTDSLEFWKPMFAHKAFKDACNDRYALKVAVVDAELESEVKDLLG
ncbi:DNA repair protein [Cronobacter phage S13]|uniref:DNA repair protein n=1 Tax=Cronobacter phage S13 TaxID=1327935 RepID=UPI00049AD6B5|nr:DNA repair protein [Cronobacter phage S13]AIA65048.1 putative RecA-like recombination protein [Cronobacter phage S13]